MASCSAYHKCSYIPIRGTLAKPRRSDEPDLHPTQHFSAIQGTPVCLHEALAWMATALYAGSRIEADGLLGEASSHVPDEPAIENRLKPRPDFYALEYPGPENVFLVVEVMDSSASDDREVNVPHDARFGIPETWLVDVVIDNKHGQDSPVGIKISV